MPRLYCRPAEFLAHPVAKGLGAGDLDAGAVDRALMAASDEADKFCRHRLQVCGATTLAEAASRGATQISLAACLGFDGGPDTQVRIGSGATQETLQAAGFGENPLTGESWQSVPPYAAELQLHPGAALAYDHAVGEPVRQYYYEQVTPIGGSVDPVDQYFDMTQAGQIAMAHSPHMGVGQNIRTIFLRNLPILEVVGFAVAYPWANVLDAGTVSDLFVNYAEGWLRMPIGYFNPPNSVDHVLYNGGKTALSGDIRKAVIYLAAADLSFGTNYLGAQSFKRGDYSVDFTGWAKGTGESSMLFVKEAQRLLLPYRTPV